jgi:hypothetical protein
MPRINKKLDQAQTPGLLDAGWYKLEAVDSMLKDAASGRGQVLSFTYRVVDGTSAGRRFFDNMNIEHENPTAAAIGAGQLKMLAIACQHPTPDFVEWSEELHSKPFMGRVKQETGKDQKIRNRLVDAKPLEPLSLENRAAVAGFSERDTGVELDGELAF